MFKYSSSLIVLLFLVISPAFSQHQEKVQDEIPNEAKVLEGNWVTESIVIFQGSIRSWYRISEQPDYRSHSTTITSASRTLVSETTVKSDSTDTSKIVKNTAHETISYEQFSQGRIEVTDLKTKQKDKYRIRCDGDTLKMTFVRSKNNDSSSPDTNAINANVYPSHLFRLGKNEDAIQCFIYRKVRTETPAEVKARSAIADAQRKVILGQWTLTKAEWAKPGQAKPDASEHSTIAALHTLSFAEKTATSTMVISKELKPLYDQLGRELVEPSSAYEFGFQPKDWLTICRFEPQDVLHPEPCRFRYNLDGDTLTLAHEPEYPDFYPASLKVTEAKDCSRVVLTYTRTKK